MSHWYVYHSQNAMGHDYKSSGEHAVYLPKDHKKLIFNDYIWVIEGDQAKPINFTLVDCFQYKEAGHPPFSAEYSKFKIKIIGEDSLLDEEIKLDNTMNWFSHVHSKFIKKQRFFVNLSNNQEVVDDLLEIIPTSISEKVEQKIPVNIPDHIENNDVEMLFGEIHGYPEGSLFESREQVRLAGLHRHSVAGIAGKANDGADAIVLNEGYEDDEDFGNEVIYTGQGGRDQNTGAQNSDQELTKGNAALVTSCLHGYPVRVIRGHKLRSKYSPDSGYRYDGLYLVESYWWEEGKSGYKIIRFRLRKSGQILQSVSLENQPEGNESPEKITTTVTRTVRDTKISNAVKNMYKDVCQICGETIHCEGGTYSEGAHIRPLGKPHNGPDTMSNILCLCPNHHVQFDKGGIGISDDLSIIGMAGELNIHLKHDVDSSHFKYHRSLFPNLVNKECL